MLQQELLAAERRFNMELDGLKSEAPTHTTQAVGSQFQACMATMHRATDHRPRRLGRPVCVVRQETTTTVHRKLAVV